MIAALLLAAQFAPAVAAAVAPAPACLTCAQAAPAPRRTPYRLDRTVADAPTAKDRALREDGSYCAVIGARQCTRKPRTIFRTDFTD